MEQWILINIGIIAGLVLIGIILTLVFWKRNKVENIQEPNYQVFFSIGIIWVPVGVVFMIAVNFVIGISFLSLGGAYLAIGLANKDKWKKKE